MENTGSLGRVLPTALLARHCATIARLWTTQPTAPTSRPVTSISLDPWRSIWLPYELQQTPTCSKLSLPGYRQLTPFSLRRDTRSVPGWSKYLCGLWPRGGQICTIRYSVAMCSQCYLWNCFVQVAVPTTAASEVARTAFRSVMMLCNLHYSQSSPYYLNQTVIYIIQHVTMCLRIQYNEDQTRQAIAINRCFE